MGFLGINDVTAKGLTVVYPRYVFVIKLFNAKDNALDEHCQFIRGNI